MIKIIKQDIATMDTDAVVNAANEYLSAGSGVCGAIFKAAGYEQLQAVCNRIGYCPTGKAVITPGFNLKAKYIIHADKNGEAIIFKRNRPQYMLVNLDENPQIEMSDEEKILFVGKRILQKHINAFKELAK